MSSSSILPARPSATRGTRLLDQLYTKHKHVYKALPPPPFGKSDHNSILLLPGYKQKLKGEKLVVRSVQKWSEEADAMLQDCFASADSNMFRCSSNSIDVFTTTVTGFIRKCIDDVVPTVTVLLYLNQKPRVNGEISRVGAAERRTAHNNGRNGQMEWHQTPRNHVLVVFDTIPLILLPSLPQAHSPQLRCHQPTVDSHYAKS
jgi:hypothetical protein